MTKLKSMKLFSIMLIISLLVPQYTMVKAMENSNINLSPMVDTNNLVFNGSFEESEATDDTSSWPEGKKPTNWTASKWWDNASRWGLPDFILKKESENHYVQIELNSDIAGKVRALHKSVNIATNPNTNYEVSIELALDSVSGNNFGLNVVQYDQSGIKVTENLLFTQQGTLDWKEFSGQISTKEQTRSIVIEMVIGTTNAVNNGGTIKFDNVRMIPHNAEVEEIILADTTTVYQEISVKLDVIVKPDNASYPNVIWTTSDSAIATVDAQGIVTGVSPGIVEITATSESNPNISATTKVTVEGLGLKQIILPTELKVIEHDEIKLVPNFIPMNTPNQEVTWSSNNPNVASVDEAGVVLGNSVGEAIITATSIDDPEIEANVNISVYEDDPATWDEFKKLQMRWKTVLLDGVPYTGDDSSIALFVEEYAKNTTIQAQNYWEQLITSDNRQYLWEDQQIIPGKNSNALEGSGHRLRIMALAYSMEGGDLYHNTGLLEDIIESLDWIHENWYTVPGEKYGNSWMWDIGAPLKFTDIYVLLADHLSKEQITTYANAIDHYTGDYHSIVSTGANLSDILSHELRLGIVEKNAERLAIVSEKMSPLFDYVTTGDGFYVDGSFIQHNSIAYTGSYGPVLIRGAANLLYMLNGTSWEVTNPKVQNVYNWVFDAFAPVMYNGQMMDMVRGRAISRHNETGQTTVRGVMSGLITLAEAAPPKLGLEMKQLVKHMILADSDREITELITSNKQLETVTAWLNDDSIVAKGDLPNHFELNAMNRSVHKGEQYAFGISKSSKRIWTFELLNGENRKGWYTGDGMTFLYNNDATQYTDEFWSTVNYNRLPGTTVVVRPRKSDHYQWGDGEGAPGNVWAGGTTLDKYGISGMQLKQNGTKMSINKSWFMFDDEIVALGSDLNSQDNKKVETIIEQRKINNEGNNVLTVNGIEQSAELGWALPDSVVTWAHLAGSLPNSDIGYYFPNKQTVNMVRQQQTGTWFDINRAEQGTSGGPTDERSRNYVTMWYDHGENPVGKTYSYVLLPNRSVEEVENYANEPNIEILVNDADVHGVRHKQLGITGFNFWGNKPLKSDFLTSSTQSSIMVRENSDQTLEIAVSDPTLENKGIIEIELDKSAAKLIEADPQVKVTQLAPTIKFQVEVNGSLGQTFLAKFDMDPNRPAVDTTELVAAIKAAQAKIDVAVAGNQPGQYPQAAINELIVAIARTQGVIDLAVLQDEVDQAVTELKAAVIAFEQLQIPVADQTAPTWSAEAKLSVSNINKTSLVLSWTEATDNIAVSDYRIYKNGSELVTVAGNTTSYIVTDLTAGTTYNFTVKAGDAAGHWSLNGPSLSVTTKANSNLSPDPIPEENDKPSIPLEPLEPTEPLKPETPNVEFTDIANHWAKSSIEKAVEIGIINGYGDSTFRPNGTVTRGEFATMLARALKVELDDTTFDFADIGKTPVWTKTYIQALVNAGFIKGYDDGTFRANNEITRSEMVVTVVRALGLKVNPEEVLVFDDADQVPVWAKAYVASAAQAGLIKGNGDGKFYPKATSSRAEAVTLILMMLNTINNIEQSIAKTS